MQSKGADMSAAQEWLDAVALLLAHRADVNQQVRARARCGAAYQEQGADAAVGWWKRGERAGGGQLRSVACAGCVCSRAPPPPTERDLNSCFWIGEQPEL
jgi:hypothetical protein